MNQEKQAIITMMEQLLIDTWWNVNQLNTVKGTCFLAVLIDTWWNVNYYYRWYKHGLYEGFNRYMVECECGRTGGKGWSRCVLIDTWWNVNENLSGLMSWIWSGFNRYMVECEFAYDERNIINRTGFNRYMVECE